MNGMIVHVVDSTDSHVGHIHSSFVKEYSTQQIVNHCACTRSDVLCNNILFILTLPGQSRKLEMELCIVSVSMETKSCE